MKTNALALFIAAGLLGSAASAQTLVHDYVFQNNFNDSVGTIALTSNGGILGAGSLAFGENQGPTLKAEGSLSSSYSIGLQFSLSDLSGYRKILDYKLLSSDGGFYTHSGEWTIFPAVIGPDFLSPNQKISLVLTRDASTNVFTAYVNGAIELSFIDSGGLAIASLSNGFAIFNFFQDDSATSFTEASGGVVNEIRVWNGALASTSIATAFAPIVVTPPTPTGLAPVPEPSTYALAGVAALGGIIALRRRKTKVELAA